MNTESKERGKSDKARSERSKARPQFISLVKGYLGFLTGTGKSLSTISSYKGDLDLFEKFLKERKRDFYRISARDLEAYQHWLERNGLKMNTRRRKVLSAKALVKYAVSRKKLPATNSVQYVKTPERLERLPWIPSPSDYRQILGAVDSKTQTGLRNLLVVTLLAETGITLAELCRLRWDQWSGDLLTLTGERRSRKLRLSGTTVTKLQEWRTKNPGKHLFPGFNRYGVTSEKMTPRGVELFFRQVAKSTGLRALKPKTLRHYCVLEWLRLGVADGEIQKRLGVHPNYSLALYKKVLEREAAL